MGISGPQVIISTPQGIRRSRDVRRLVDGECWNKQVVDSCTSTSKSYLIPSDESPAFEIPVVPRPAVEVPQFSEGGAPTRRMGLHPADFVNHGYTDGCPECIRLRSGGLGNRKHHNEDCRRRIEAELIKTPEGRLRKDREELRREVEFEQYLKREDEKVTSAESAPRPEQAAASSHGPVPVPAIDPEFERMMQEDEDDDNDDDLAGLFEDDDRERSESYLAEEPPAKRARGEGDDEVLMLAPKLDEDLRLLALVLRGCDVMELYSPERVGRICHRHRLTPGPALDLRTGYDFDKPSDRAKAMRLYEESQPELVVLSPPCTEFSRLQDLNRYLHGDKYRELHDELKRRAVKHLEFCFRFAKMQMRKGRYFLFEHPAGASSWNEPCVQRLLKLPGVEVTEADQCQFGLVTPDPDGDNKPALKPTRFASNSWLLLEELTRRCPRDHEH